MNVGIVRRSRRLSDTEIGVSDALRAARATAGSNSRGEPPVEHQRLDHVASDAGPSDTPHDLRTTAPAAPSGDPRPDEHQIVDVVAGVATDREPGSGSEERLGDEELAASLHECHARFIDAAGPGRQHSSSGTRPPGGSRHPLPILLGQHSLGNPQRATGIPRVGGRVNVRRDAGAALGAAAAEVASVRREVLADREVERAAVERLDLLEDALPVGVGADHGGAPAVL